MFTWHQWRVGKVIRNTLAHTFCLLMFFICRFGVVTELYMLMLSKLDIILYIKNIKSVYKTIYFSQYKLISQMKYSLNITSGPYSKNAAFEHLLKERG